MTVVDDADRLGGTLRICDTDSIKTELLAFRDYLIREVGRRDIEVRLGEHVDAQFVRDFAPEALVIAIGATPLQASDPGHRHGDHAGVDAYFVDPSTIGERVVMLGGGLVGLRSRSGVGRARPRGDSRRAAGRGSSRSSWASTAPPCSTN